MFMFVQSQHFNFRFNNVLSPSRRRPCVDSKHNIIHMPPTVIQSVTIHQKVTPSVHSFHWKNIQIVINIVLEITWELGNNRKKRKNESVAPITSVEW